MFRRVVIIIGTLLSQFVVFSNIQADTLIEALTYTYNNNMGLKSAQEGIKATDEKIFQAISGWLPTVSYQIQSGNEKTTTYNNKANISSGDNTKIFSVTQPLFNNGASIAGFKVAQQTIQASRATLTNEEQKVLHKAIVAYVGVVQAHESLMINKKKVEAMSRHIESANERFKLGEATRTDVAQAKYNLSDAIYGQTKSEGAYIAACASYKAIIGLEPNNVNMPEELAELPATLEEFVALVNSNNPELLNAKYSNKAAKFTVLQAAEGLLPTVYFQYTNTLQNPYIVPGVGSYPNARIATSLFNFNIPIYQGGKTYSQIRQSKYSEKQSKAQYQDAELIIVQKAIEAWEELETSRSNVTSTHESIEFASIALEGVKQEYEVGTRTFLDVLDQENALFEYKLRYVKARSELVSNSYAIKYLAGSLTAKGLGLPVKTFDPVKHYNQTKFKIIGF